MSNAFRCSTPLYNCILCVHVSVRFIITNHITIYVIFMQKRLFYSHFYTLLSYYFKLIGLFILSDNYILTKKFSIYKKERALRHALFYCNRLFFYSSFFCNIDDFRCVFNNLNLTVTAHASTSRNQFTDDYIFF